MTIKQTDLFENIDYEFTTVDADQNIWGVRLLTGPFPETVVAYHTVSYNENDEVLNFSFGIVSSPDDELVVENEELQQYCGLILESILEDGLKDGSVVEKEKSE